MTIALPRIDQTERTRFAIIVAFLLINSLVLESNEVIATSGFVSHLGVEHIVWVWALDMGVVMLTAALYSMIVDRTNRVALAMRLFTLFSLLYLAFSLLFQVEGLAWLAYPLLTILNDQQWSLFGLLIWALASDIFSTAQSKRLFPLLAMAVIVGSIVGNGAVAIVSQFLQGRDDQLLIGNALLMAGLALGLFWFQRHGKFEAYVRPAVQEESVTTVLREGFVFVREVPIFRYLALAMIPLGLGFNTLEYYLLHTLSTMDIATLPTTYGSFKSMTAISLLLVQALVTTRLINHIGLQRVFVLLPIILLLGLGTMLLLPVLAIFGANYLVRVTLQGIDEPARQMVKNLAPDERRGRVGAFLNGYLYPIGAIVGCVQIGIVMELVRQSVISVSTGQWTNIMLSLCCVLFALWSTLQLHQQYDASLLNWRLDRRKRRSSIPNFDLLEKI